MSGKTSVKMTLEQRPDLQSQESNEANKERGRRKTMPNR
jgi:hypothetical protein